MSGRPVPPHDPAEEIEELAALLADVVELTRSTAMYPGHFALIAAMRVSSGHCG